MSIDLDIFVSYKREEAHLRDKVIRALQDANFTTFADAEIDKGENFNEVLDRMVRSAKLTLVLWTEAATRSQWIPKEARLTKKLQQEAKDKGREVSNIYLPVYIGDLGAQMPMDLADDQGLEFDSPLSETALKEIISEVSKLIEPKERGEIDSAPTSSFALEQDLRQYQFALRVDSEKSYEVYLRDFPNGAFAQDAQERIKALPLPQDLNKKQASWAYFAEVMALGATVLFLVGAIAYSLQLIVPGSAVKEAKDSYEQRLNEQELANKSRLEKAAVELQNLNAMVESLETERDQLSDQASSLNETIDKLETKNRNLSLQIRKLERQVSKKTDADCPDRFGKERLWVVNTCVNFDATSLNLENIGDLTLQDVKKLTFLRKLFLDGASNIDLETIMSLPLTHLSLRSTNVNDIAALANISTLESLNLDPSLIEDLSPIADLPNLRVLFAPNGNVYLDRDAVKFYQESLK
ncbi:hypothetical protein TRP8649_00784 [Pelagimonas phthalicica]|uniref:TIR domain-containing protein n=1 Tax=Pelagimonas phthalicica TaxID=1037362 RepID=A0A238J7Y0_9RHOB|nr:TIR domain-containing protein [Pelagimonas phthalicica]TDS94772.1 TIR domain-containing protein [Pelagimonas phthalicica]SMX26699.1 hypothetical protein TRP8649_00784 [Pelagimonas phthalicica]